MKHAFGLAMVAVLAAGSASAGMMGGGGGPLVAADGTIVAVAPSFESGTAYPTNIELVAVSGAGIVLWRHAIGFGVADAVLLGDLVVVAGGGASAPGPMMGRTSTRVVALRLATGAEAWSLELDGIGMHLAAAADRVYLRLVTPSATGQPGGNPVGGRGHVRGRGGMGGGWGGDGAAGLMQGRSVLVALSATGQELWRTPLQP